MSKQDRRTRLFAILILAAGVLGYMLALNAPVAKGGLFAMLDRGTTISPELVTTYGAVVRLPATGGWTYLRDGAHVTAGFTTLECRTNGVLRLNMIPFYNVASVWVSPDETLSRRGVLAGASVNRAYMDIHFTRATANGPERVSCRSSVLRGDVANVWVGAIGQVTDR